MPPEMERRPGELVECRGSTANGLKRLGGLAAVFGSPSRLLPGGFHEIVSPRAFASSKAEGWVGVTAKFEHRDILGTIRGNTLALDVTGQGLDYTVDVVSSSIGEHAYALAQRGDLASSFAFVTLEDWFEMGRDGIPVRHLDSVSLRDVSCVADPAYSDSTCAMRSLARHMSAPYSDVQDYAQNGRLAAFFTRTDRAGYHGKRPLTRQQREVELMRVRWPEDRAKPLTAKQREVELMRVRWPEDRAKPLTAKQREVELMRVRWPEDRAKPLTAKQREVELMRMRWPEDRVTEVMNPLWLQ
jgi:HK97 family phage prohead protease